MLKKLFSPYAEFEMNTTLSPEVLRAGIAERCMKAHSFSSYSQRLRAFASPSQPPEFAVVRLDPPALEPLLGMRNSMQPVVTIDMESRNDGGALLKVTLAPSAFNRVFFIVLIVFSAVFCIPAAFALPWLLLIFPVFALLGAAVMVMCREMGEESVAGVEAAFKALIRELESAGRNV
jgi:hypothetical protein